MQLEEDVIRLLDSLTNDSGRDHDTADDLIVTYLRDMGHEKVADAFDRASERCGFCN